MSSFTPIESFRPSINVIHINNNSNNQQLKVAKTIKKRKRQEGINLNEAIPSTRLSHQPHIMTATSIITPFFHSLSETFIKTILDLQPSGLLISIYWFNDHQILDFLIEQKIPVFVIVQKQNVWSRTKQSLSSISSNKINTKETRKKQKKDVLRLKYDSLSPYVTYSSEPVKCLGVSPGLSILHYKTIIYMNPHNEPVALWYGSMNFTENSKKNLESTLLIQNVSLANVFHSQFLELMKHTESLSWKSNSLANSSSNSTHMSTMGSLSK